MISDLSEGHKWKIEERERERLCLMEYKVGLTGFEPFEAF